MIEREDIGAALSDSKDEGLWAEFDGERLSHIGRYERGRPVIGCWTIDIDHQTKSAKASRTVEVGQTIDDANGESWLRKILQGIVAFTENEHRCSFCEKLVAAEAHLIKGPGVSICDECVELSLEILIEAGAFSRARMLPLLMKRRGTNREATEHL